MDRSHKMAWAAGFVDGDGYITIGRRGPYKGRKSHYLRLGVNHVAKKPLYVMQELFGGSLEFQDPEKVHGNRYPRTRWIVNTKNAYKVLKEILPYMVNKTEVAKLGIQFQETMGTTKKTSDEVYEKREQIRQRIKYLNSID